MKKRTLIIFFAVVTTIALVALTAISFTSPRGSGTAISQEELVLVNSNQLEEDSINVQSPNTFVVKQELRYDNIQVFLLNGVADIPGDRYLTLDIAMENKKVVVLETSDVNELKINNLSDKYVYINSGDIVRGGKQDRTIQYDIIIPPNAKNVPLASFCVESGRWNSRAEEQVGSFSSSKNSLSNKELKVAAKVQKNQGEVWSKVAEYQDKAERAVGYMASEDIVLKDQASPTSLELTLESKELKKLQEIYKSALTKQINDKTQLVGMAVFINGELASMDIYNNQQLFDDLFNKLLEAAIAEAISEKKKETFNYASEEKVKDLFIADFKLKNTEKVNEITTFITSVLQNQLMFTTIDLSVKKWLHYNWLETTEANKNDRGGR